MRRGPCDVCIRKVRWGVRPSPPKEPCPAKNPRMKPRSWEVIFYSLLPSLTSTLRAKQGLLLDSVSSIALRVEVSRFRTFQSILCFTQHFNVKHLNSKCIGFFHLLWLLCSSRFPSLHCCAGSSSATRRGETGLWYSINATQDMEL